ncbi:MAG: hypothetical protein ACOY3Y_12060, partial [Acidobacteriota bacterium]
MAHRGRDSGVGAALGALLLGLTASGCHTLFSHAPLDTPPDRSTDGASDAAAKRPVSDRAPADGTRPDAKTPDLARNPDLVKNLDAPGLDVGQLDVSTPDSVKKPDAPKADSVKKPDAQPDGAKLDAPRDAAADQRKDAKTEDLGDGVLAPSWKLVNHGLGTAMLLGVWGVAANGVVAVGKGCTIWVGNGTTWQALPKPAGCSADLRGIWGTGGTLHAVGDGGLVVRIEGSPLIATVVNAGSASLLWSSFGESATKLWAVGDGPTVRALVGANWTSEVAGIAAGTNLRDLFTTSTLHVTVGKTSAGGPALYTRVPPQTSWASCIVPNLSATAALRAAFGTSANDVIVAGDQGSVARFNGTAWTNSPKSISTATILHGLWASDPYNYVAVGTTTNNACGGGSGALGTPALHHFASTGSANVAPSLP